MAVILAIVASMGSVATASIEELSADFSSDVSTGAAPLTVHFMDRSAGSPTGWQWDFGDGSSSTRQDPTYTFQTPGTYTVTLTVTDGADVSSASGEITVTDAPAATPQPIRVVPVPVHPINPGDHVKNPIHKNPVHKNPVHKKPIKMPDAVKKPGKTKRGSDRGNVDNPVHHFY